MNKCIKRCFDIIASGVGLIVISPLLVGLAILVKVDSSGSAFFCQERVGRKGKLFTLVKLRTMVSEKKGEGNITKKEDKRITKIGMFLRTSALDELPQLWNVLKGDMSLVGPRPEVPEMVESYPKEKKEQVLSVRPGITGLAQTEYGDKDLFTYKGNNVEAFYKKKVLPKKLDFDMLYVKKQSFLFDMDVLLRTLKLLGSRFSKKNILLDKKKYYGGLLVRTLFMLMLSGILAMWFNRNAPFYISTLSIFWVLGVLYTSTGVRMMKSDWEIMYIVEAVMLPFLFLFFVVLGKSNGYIFATLGAGEILYIAMNYLKSQPVNKQVEYARNA